MKKTPITYKFFAIFTSVLLMLSSVSFSANLHFCQDKLEEISFFSNSKSCCEKPMAEMSCENEPSTPDKCLKKEHSGCCSNQIITSQNTQEALFNGEFEIHIQKWISSPIILSEYFYSFSNEVITTKKEVSYLKYSPPRLTRNIVILVEQFLC